MTQFYFNFFFFSRRIKLFSTRKQCLFIFKCFTIFNFILVFDQELYKLKISYIQVHVYYKTVKVFFSLIYGQFLTISVHIFVPFAIN